MQSIYLTPADKEITIYISFHIIHLVFGLVQCLVERLFTTPPVTLYTKYIWYLMNLKMSVNVTRESIQVYIKLYMIVEPGFSVSNNQNLHIKNTKHEI